MCDFMQTASAVPPFSRWLLQYVSGYQQHPSLLSSSCCFCILGRYQYATVVLRDNTVWVMGGLVGDAGRSDVWKQNDVWKSIDGGASWQLITGSSGWSGKHSPPASSL